MRSCCLPAHPLTSAIRAASMSSECTRRATAVRERRAVDALRELCGFVDKLIAEDEPVLNTMRFRKGVLVASDRHLARYFKYVQRVPARPAALRVTGPSPSR